jgi:hypothetical protein
MARTKKRRRSKGGFTLPLAVVGGLVPAGADILSAYKIGGAEAALGHVSLVTTGFDPADGSWKPGFAFQKLYGPLFVAFMVHKLAARLGINRALGRAGVPFVRV